MAALAAPVIRAAGTVLWRPGPEVAVVHRPRYDDWSLPKGKAHAGESLPACARRETVEETGLDAALTRWLARTAYRVEDGAEKHVDWWAARCGSVVGGVSPDEVDGLAWLPVAEAMERLTWDSDRSVLARFDGVATTTVLLVRHAWAGSSEAWRGPDDERPLDPRGRDQVAALAATLPAFWLSSEHPVVLSAPPVRCVETVAWAGSVRTDERLRVDDVEAALACVRELGSLGVAVACSQGGVIPAVVESLRREDGLPPAATPDAKGSTWVLSFAGGRLAAADYVEAP